MTGFLPRMPEPGPALRATERSSAALAGSGLLAPEAPALLAPPPLALERIDTAERFDEVSAPAGDLVVGGRAVKFLIDRRDPSSPVLRFVNGSYTRDGQVPEEARYHYLFGQAVFGIGETLDEFNAVTYFTEDKRYVAGVLRTYTLEPGAAPVYGIQFYPQDLIRERAVLDTVDLVRAAFGLPGARLAFVPTGLQQTSSTIRDDLAARGVEVIPLDEILGTVRYLPLNLGEAWGRLRIFPADPDELTAGDIVVFDDLPLDLSVVAGVLTRAVQDTNSHVNLKSKERRTPNAVLRDAGPDDPRLAPFADQPVHLVVDADDLTIEATTDEVVAAKLAERFGRPLVRIPWELETALRSFDEIAAGTPREARAHAARYGSKAAHLGFLAHRDVLGRVTDAGSPSARRGYDLVPQGFAVPSQAYRDFVEHPANASLRALIDDLVAEEQAGRLSPKDRAERVARIQAGFMAASFPPGALERVRARLNEVLPGVRKVKVRSSANVEDVAGFDGAGLHDSFAADTGKPDIPDGPCRFEDDTEPGGETKRKVKPKSLGCAIKGVYASLWNKRAVEERSFARIDQSGIAMGLAILPVYDAESEVAANAVIVTRVLNTDGVFGYTLSVQEGNNVVTNPAPGTHSESTIAAFLSAAEPLSLTVTRYAKPAADAPVRTEPVLPRERMAELVELSRRVEEAYCRATPGYYRDCRDVASAANKRAALDLEVKILANGQVVCKQVREFSGR